MTKYFSKIEIFTYFYYNFSVFCECNFMQELISIVKLRNKFITLEIVKSFSLLILNLKSTTTLFYIFSNNIINQIIQNNFERYDDDFTFYYINFLKSLSLKICNTTIQFFFNEEHNTFPLLNAALNYYNYPDPMIKNTVRNIILTLIKRIFIIIYNITYYKLTLN